MKTQDLVAAWSRRPPREKLLIAVVAVAATLALGDALLTAPLEKRVRRAQQSAQALQTRWAELQDVAEGSAAHDAGLRAQEAQWRERLQTAQQAAAQTRRRLADTARLPQTLRAITTTVGSARLLQLDLSGDTEGGPAAAAPSTNPATPAAASSPSAPRRLYRLPITLRVAGSWDELQALLGQIEQHADALQWTSITLDSSAWPAIELTLKAQVPSLEPRWGASL